MNRMKTFCLAALTISANACSTDSEIGAVQLRPVDARHLAVHRRNGPEAIVSDAGEISVNGKQVILDGAQKNLAIGYFTLAKAVRDDGFATGMAGASTALTAISSVVSGLASGEPDKIGQDVEVKAAKVEAQAEKLCRDLRELAATQDALAAALPEFKPYALIGEKEVGDCGHG